ncbi:MAG: HAD family phosphatase [Clostridia bacterium]|nr:HAD family phosphatase [Clostridia bacterium]
MIKNIIFDIGRVLIGFEWKEYIRGLFDEETGQKVTDAIWKDGRWYELDRGVLRKEEILESFYQAEPELKQEIRETFDRVGECLLRRDYAIPWIEELKARGFAVYFLSNYSEHLMRANPHVLDFLPHMDGGVFSCYVKLIKPDPAIYLCLLEKYGLKAEECLFIDDREENVAAARELGMQTVRFESHEQARAVTDSI